MENGEQTFPEPKEEQDTDFNAEVANEEIALLLEDARNKADEHWNQLLRVKADMENLRRRNERDLESAHKYALEKFAGALLPVKDSLELGLTAAGASSAPGPEQLANLREGMELTNKMLQSVMEKFGIRELDPLGQKFNPELHQAMTTQEAAGVEPNTVVTVCQKAYTLQDRLIRPAMVIVSR